MSNQDLNLNELVNRLLENLDARSKDIVSRRYGLENDQPETLESIGREYGITRERVRQIQSHAKKSLLNQDQLLEPVAALLQDIFTNHGGIIAEPHVVDCVREELGSDIENPHRVSLFYLDILDPYKRLVYDDKFDIHWRHPDHVSAQAGAIVETAGEILKQAKHPISGKELITKVRGSLKLATEDVSDEIIITQLIASRAIVLTAFDEWGLVGWPETTPRGVGDKAYTVMRRNGKPEHFMGIADLINQAAFDNKTANPQTVHNELIKDERFVLVGRGMYALSEWGYVNGTVADVIEDILAKSQKSMSKDEIIEKVLEQRQVKKNTILLGLQNSKRFKKENNGTYTVA